MACLFHCRTRSRALSSKHHLPRLFVADQGIVLDRCTLIRVKHVFKRISIGVSHRLRMLQDRVVESLVIYTWGPSPRSASSSTDVIVPNSTGTFRRHRPFKESIRTLQHGTPPPAAPVSQSQSPDVPAPLACSSYRLPPEHGTLALVTEALYCLPPQR